MFISKINKLFHKHGKIAFGFLTLVIIIPFVLYFSADPADFFGMFSFGSVKSNVSMSGSFIPQKEIDQAVQNVTVTFTLQGWPVNLGSSDNQKQFLPMAVNKIILNRQAEKLGLQATDLQIAEYLRSMPLFQVNGQFSMYRYQMLLYGLSRYNVSEKDLERIAGENVLEGLLRRQITGSAITSEAGAKQYFYNSNEKYAIRLALFDSKDYLKSVKIDNKVLDNYFQANNKKYIDPAKSKALIVRFNFINYKKEAEKKVTDAIVDSHYQQNKAMYAKMSASDAKEKIKDRMLKQAEQEIAKNDAQKFAVAAFKMIEQSGSANKNGEQFEKYAKKMDFNVYPVNDWITAKTKLIPRIGKEPALTKAVSALFMDQPVSNAVEGKTAYFVACLTDRQNARPAKLSEVKNKVVKNYKQEQAIKMARDAAAKAKTEIEKGVKNKKNIKELLDKYNFDKNFEFTARDLSYIDKEKFAHTAFDLTTKTEKGNVSSVADTPDGAIIVYVDKIILPSESDFKKNSNATMIQYEQFMQHMAWMNYNAMLKKQAQIKVYVSKDKNTKTNS